MSDDFLYNMSMMLMSNSAHKTARWIEVQVEHTHYRRQYRVPTDSERGRLSRDAIAHDDDGEAHQQLRAVMELRVDGGERRLAGVARLVGCDECVAQRGRSGARGP